MKGGDKGEEEREVYMSISCVFIILPVYIRIWLVLVSVCGVLSSLHVSLIAYDRMRVYTQS